MKKTRLLMKKSGSLHLGLISLFSIIIEGIYGVVVWGDEEMKKKTQNYSKREMKIGKVS